MPDERILLEARFNPRVRHYWMLGPAIVFAVTIVGIPLLILWLPLGLYYTRRYLDRMRCALTRIEGQIASRNT